MRLWSLHPKYLDAKGLVALWREGLLALHVLQGKTKGYFNHPQLSRFRLHANPIIALQNYLHAVVDEAEKRGYHFDRNKLSKRERCELIAVTSGQLAYEADHLKQKLIVRDKQRFEEIIDINRWELHQSFRMVEGRIEDWERIGK